MNTASNRYENRNTENKHSTYLKNIKNKINIVNILLNRQKLGRR